MAAEMPGSTLWITIEESKEPLNAVFDEAEFLLLNFTPITKVLLATLLSINMVIGLIGKYALIKRIMDVGFDARPINLLMIFDEVIGTLARMTMMTMIIFVLVTGMSLQSTLDQFTKWFFGLTLPFCHLFVLFQIFGKVYESVASFHIALFRCVIIWN